MSKDPRDEALDTIQDLVNNLMAQHDLSAEVRHDLELIESLARHRDIGTLLLDSRESERLARIRHAGEPAGHGQE